MRPRNVARGSWEFMVYFFKKKQYDRAMQAVADIGADPHAGVVTADQVKLVLGEWLDIWPDSIAPKCTQSRG
jgi:hypothetical protein